MARYQLTSSLLLLAILVAHVTAEAPRRLRLSRQRHAFARQEVQPTPYPSADELKPEEPALIYGPPPSTDVNELPAEEEPPANSFQPDVEEVDIEENSLEEVTTPAAAARLRSSRQRLAKLQLAKAQPKRKRQRIARLEELPVEAAAPAVPVAPVAPVAPAVPVAPVAALPAPQLYYVGGQQPYVVAYTAASQQLAW
ncbi:PREDICTED: translation initiation factor IF-2 [Drosophila arizonae]|uniref:Translation initiation factor IF-2 n=1 Tax=Drosophila arizonae TaxID=7263 RepID=A0ABM1P225_DROAR|nr:PREDICTED: translation initiation factor IF-2 [Drosophila arizonae]